MSTSPTHVQQHYRCRTDADDVNTAGTFRTEDAGWSQDVDTNFRARFTVANTGSGGGTARAWSIWAKLNSGSYFAVTTTSSIVKSVDASSSADNASITSRQLTAGTGTWQNGLYDESGATTTMALTNGYYTEFEFGLQIVGADVANGDTISLRVYNFNAALNGGYTQDCTAVTAVKAITLVADSIAVAAPTVGDPAVYQKQVLAASNVVASAPVLDSSSLSLIFALSPAGLSVAVPAVGAPAFEEIEGPIALPSPASLVVAVPTISVPAVIQTHGLLTPVLNIAVPAISVPAVTQRHALAASAVSAAALTIVAASIAQTHNLSGAVLSTATVTVSAPTLAIEGAVYLLLGDDTIDLGLGIFVDCDKIHVCNTMPTSYAEVGTYTIGSKAFAGGGGFGAPQDTGDGRSVTSLAISNGSVTGDGLPICWAAVDESTTRFLAAGPLGGGVPITNGQLFELEAFTINRPNA